MGDPEVIKTAHPPGPGAHSKAAFEEEADEQDRREIDTEVSRPRIGIAMTFAKLNQNDSSLS
jgi:hypothetical protein